ncbi:MAG: peptide-methionine (S)-S-oxide reductase, partial [Magnetospirillum gryphiswaldense]|nr:peptide-methionine (S)-S-oxide reductase [Magnetospirillum gryphiswaldense]
VTDQDQEDLAKLTAHQFGNRLSRAGFGPVTTEIARSKPFYYAEAYHQQYLARNPDGYCGLSGTGVSCG